MVESKLLSIIKGLKKGGTSMHAHVKLIMTVMNRRHILSTLQIAVDF